MFVVDIAGLSLSLIHIGILGVLVGLIAGMFGVGGGFLLVPLLHVFLGVPLPIAVAAGLCQTIATAVASLIRYRKFGFAESRFDVLLLGGSMLGVDAGTRLLLRLSNFGSLELLGREISVLRVVLTVFYLTLFSIMSGILFFKKLPPAGGPTVLGPMAKIRFGPTVWLPVVKMRVSALVVTFVGFGNGVLAGMLGIGGGIVLVPIMLYGFGFDIRKSSGTGIVVVLAVALVGTTKYAYSGTLHLGLAGLLMVGSAIASQFGANLTRSLSTNTLRKGLALILLSTNVTLLIKVFKF